LHQEKPAQILHCMKQETEVGLAINISLQ
jgi:hypothetical protein